MKKIIYISLLFISVFTIASCEKNLIELNNQWEVSNPANANVKFINAYTSNVPAGAPGVGVTRFYIYQNTQKLNGNALSTAGSWPGPATYASLAPTSPDFYAVLDRRVGNDYGKPVKGDTAFKANIPLNAGKYYSVFMIGESPSQKIQVVEDKIINPVEKNFAVRFANFIVSTSTAERTLDIYSRRAGKVLASVKFGAVTEFAELPVNSIPDTLDVREAGTIKNLYSFNNFVPVSRRSYTFYTYGRGTVAPFAERLINYTNR